LLTAPGRILRRFLDLEALAVVTTKTRSRTGFDAKAQGRRQDAKRIRVEQSSDPSKAQIGSDRAFASALRLGVKSGLVRSGPRSTGARQTTTALTARACSSSASAVKALPAPECLSSHRCGQASPTGFRGPRSGRPPLPRACEGFGRLRSAPAHVNRRPWTHLRPDDRTVGGGPPPAGKSPRSATRRRRTRGPPAPEEGSRAGARGSDEARTPR